MLSHGSSGDPGVLYIIGLASTLASHLPDWCTFFYSFPTPSINNVMLFVNKVSLQAIARVRFGNAYIWYGGTGFTASGGNLEATTMGDLGAVRAFTASTWSAASDLSDPDQFEQTTSFDQSPTDLSFSPIRCDGTDASDSFYGAGSCTGGATYVAQYVSGDSGPLQWVYQSQDCSAGCEAPGVSVFTSYVTTYGEPTVIGEEMEIGCVDQINHQPKCITGKVTTNEDTPYVFSAADFQFSDPNDVPPNNFLNVLLFPLPDGPTLIVQHGVLSLQQTIDGEDVDVALGGNQTIAVADIEAGKLKYTPPTGAFGGTIFPYDSFFFQVQDDGGTAHDGIDISNQCTMNIFVLEEE